MQAYRVYVVAPDGHITAPAQVIECESEQQAIGINGKSVELWEGARFIVRFPSDED